MQLSYTASSGITSLTVAAAPRPRDFDTTKVPPERQCPAGHPDFRLDPATHLTVTVASPKTSAVSRPTCMTRRPGGQRQPARRPGARTRVRGQQSQLHASWSSRGRGHPFDTATAGTFLGGAVRRCHHGTTWRRWHPPLPRPSITRSWTTRAPQCEAAGRRRRRAPAISR